MKKSNRSATVKRFDVSVRMCLVFATIVVSACRDHQPAAREQASTHDAVAPRAEVVQPDPAPASTPPASEAIAKPDGPFLFQPLFFYRDEEPSANGTGFLVRAPGRRVAAIASAHFIDFEGTPLLQAQWTSIGDYEPRLTFEKSWGIPGDAGVADGNTIDLRPDYLILPVDEKVPASWVLKLDNRPRVEPNEVVWFPNKSDDVVNGYEWVNGKVIESKPTHIFVMLEKRIILQSQSGSPVISSKNGRVIGTLSRGSEIQGKSVLWLCPSSSIREAIENATSFPKLQDVVGKG